MRLRLAVISVLLVTTSAIATAGTRADRMASVTGVVKGHVPVVLRLEPKDDNPTRGTWRENRSRTDGQDRRSRTHSRAIGFSADRRKLLVVLRSISLGEMEHMLPLALSFLSSPGMWPSWPSTSGCCKSRYHR